MTAQNQRLQCDSNMTQSIAGLTVSKHKRHVESPQQEDLHYKLQESKQGVWGGRIEGAYSNTMGIPVVSVGDTSEAFLPCGVPDLQTQTT